MSPIEAQARVKERLISFLNSIKESDGGAISRELSRLEEILETEGGGLPSELAHLLRRRSYAKAFEDLGGETPVK